MAIDNQKVLLIRNSNVAVAELSTSVSDWYAGARGLCGTGGATDYFWLSFDFGNRIDYVDTAAGRVQHPSHTGPILDSATTPVTCSGCSPKVVVSQVGQTLVNAIRHVVSTYGINALLVLPGVPRVMFAGGSSGQQYGQFTELFLAYIYATGSSTISGNPVKTPNSSLGLLTTDGTASGFSRSGQLRPLTDIFALCNSAGAAIPSGRVGVVDFSTNPYTFSTLSDVQRIVNNAKQAELENNFSKLHVLGGAAYIRTGGTLMSTAVNFLGYDVGLTNLSYIADNPYPGEYSWTAPAGESEGVLWSRKPPFKGSAQAQMYVSSQYIPGTDGVFMQANGGGKVYPFCAMAISGYHFPELSNGRFVSNRYADYCEFLPGGIAYSFGSPSDLTSLLAIKLGASMGFSCGGEPFTTNLCDTDAILYLLLCGLTGAEACYKANQGILYTGAQAYDLAPNTLWQGIPLWTSVHGDPLYRPYKLTPINAGKVMQVGQ